MPPKTWPPRTAICLDCRTALPDGVPCPAGHARVAAFAGGGSGREALLTEVWGPRSIRQRARRAAKAGGVSGGFGAFIDGCSACDLPGGSLLDGLIVVALIFVITFLLWFIVSGLAPLIRRWRSRVVPKGAIRRGVAERATGRTGRVVEGPALARDPVTGSPCVGFAAALEHRARWWRRPATVLRDGATIGFDVVLDSGERVRVPAGPLLVDLAGAGPVRADAERLAGYLGAIDPARGTADDFDPFPCHRVRAAPIRPGDRVEILGPLEPRPNPAAPATGGYRDPAPWILVPAGLPRLRPR